MFKMKGVVAIIPARSGSKGIPGKNLLSIGGVPLLRRTIIAAREAGIKDVVVSTDYGACVRALLRSWGAIVHKRPDVLSGDGVVSEPVLLDVLKQWPPTSYPDIAVFLQCTTPFTQPIDIEKCVTEVRTWANSAFTAVPFCGHVWTQSGKSLMQFPPEKTRRPRQILPVRAIENGGCYAFKTGLFLKRKTRFIRPVSCVLVPKWRGIEIDEPEDVRIAEALAKHEAEL